MDNDEKITNLPMGSVTYAIPVKAEEISTGDSILAEEDSLTYRYRVYSLDIPNHRGTVYNSITSGSEPITVSIREYLPKVIVTLPVLGYLLIAFKTTEGLMVAGLGVLALIILYVLSEILRKDPEKEDAGETEDDSAPVKSKKELKREEKERAIRLKEEEERLRLEEKKAKKAKKKQKADKKMIRTGGFIDEIEDEDAENEAVPAEEQTIQTAASEAHEVLKKEIAAATAEETPQLETTPADKTRDVASEVKSQLKQEMTEEVLTPEEIGKLAIPVLTASKLAEQAKQAGDNPELIRDDITEVSLLDYSDIIIADE
ncbi:MAG: hypothetical protein Q4B47_00465 [Eubacteriales bacterium]|nr:hypothetical protein [Eubacteriales bacterium]